MIRAGAVSPAGFGLALLLLANSPVLAQESYADSIGFSILRAVLALIFVLGLFLLFVYLVRRYYPKALARMPHGADPLATIEVKSAKSLGPKRTLYVVRAGGRNFLLGATDQSINKLAEWPAEEEQGERLDR